MQSLVTQSPFPIQKIYETPIKRDVHRSIKIEVVKKINDPQRAAPTFVTPKKMIQSDFRQVYKTTEKDKTFSKSKQCNIKICHISRSDYNSTLSYYIMSHILETMHNSSYYRGTNISPDLFQDKMNELINGLEYVRAYIDDLIIISNGNFEDHLNKVKIVLKKLKAADFKINAEKSIFAKDN